MNRETSDTAGDPPDDATSTEPETEPEAAPDDSAETAAVDPAAPAVDDDGEVKDRWIKRWKDEGGSWLPTD